MDDGAEVFFDKCLLATAGKPRQFYVLDSDKVDGFVCLVGQLVGSVERAACKMDFNVSC